ncbi:MAG: hypothetical protein U0528_03600 [Anaerolineae bacterium]
MALTEQIQEGIRALQAGQREEARGYFAQAVREDRQNEDAWLYLGLTLDDPQRKRQAYEQVLKLNPANEKARLQLAKMGVSTNPPKVLEPEISEGNSLVESTGAFKIMSDEPETTAPPKASGPNLWDRFRSLFTTPMRTPFSIDGAPPMITISGLMSKWSRMGMAALRQLLTGKLADIDSSGSQPTTWDVVMPIAAAAFLFGASEFIGKLLIGIFNLSVGGILITPIFAALLAASAIAVGLMVGGYSGQLYLENQKSKVELRSYLSYYGNAILGAITAESILRLVGYVLIAITRNGGISFLLTVLSILLTFFVGYLLKPKLQSHYELPENSALIGTVLTVAGGWIVGRILLVVLGAIFRIG